MSDSGGSDSDSWVTASTAAAAVDAIDWDDPPLDLPTFFFEAERCSVLDYVGAFLEMSIQHMFPRAPNYDDNVVSDLATFLEMATYEDPLDDLSVFLESASRWACSKRLVGPEGTFYLFAELPCEIRLMIWRECIPSQVHLAAERSHKDCVAQQAHVNQQFVEIIDNMRGLGDCLLLGGIPAHSRYCNTACHMALRQKTPVIAKVNGEARMLALERKSKCYTIGVVPMHSRSGRIREMPVWIDEKNDTVLINTQYTDAIGIPEDEADVPDDRRSYSKADRLFGMITRNKIQVAIFAAIFIGTTLRPGLCQALINADRVNVVVGVFRFEGMTDSEAAVTELFGLFGEESMALVPAKNSQSLRKLFTAHRAFRPQSASEFFNSHGSQYLAWFVGTSTRDPRYRYTKWFPEGGRSCRPSDFEAYCEEMRGFAASAMVTCANEVALRDADGTNQFLPKLGEALRNNTTFQPVFLVHRCRKRVLIT